SWWEGSDPPHADRQRFPPIAELCYRKHEYMNLASMDFRSALRTAQKLWILDNYFDDKNGADQLAEALLLSHLKEVRIIGVTDINTQQAKERAKLLRQILEDNANGYVPTVEWRDNLMRPSEITLHDRFAIVDE